MTSDNPLKIAVGPQGVSIWSNALFDGARGADQREFLARAFAVPAVNYVELRGAGGFGRVGYAPSRNPAGIWRQLSRVLRGEEATAGDVRSAAAGLFLDGDPRRPLRVMRVGETLSTWRVRPTGEGTVRFGHPLLRQRRDIAFRLEEVLASLPGVTRFRINPLTASAAIRFDLAVQSTSRLARELEAAWPQLLDGLEGPPSRARFYTSIGLMALAGVGQFAVPPLRLVAVAGVVALSAPNVVKAARQLRRGRVGLPALYSTGLMFLLLSRMPFTGTVMAFLMQLWPFLTRELIVSRQRRLFAARRQLPVWARVPHPEGLQVEVHVEDLRPGDLVIVRRGEFVPVDGVVDSGIAAVVDELAGGVGEVDNLGPGESVNAGAFLRDGEIVVRVIRTGRERAAAHVAAALPHDVLPGLRATAEGERIANRNARPALALSLFNLARTQVLRPSQAVIRPDYVTGPRISAQFAAFEAIARSLGAGILVRRPAAIEGLADPRLLVFDETAGLERNAVSVADVWSLGASDREILAAALVALDESQSERAVAVRAAYGRHGAVTRPQVLRRRAGATIFRDDLGQEFAVVTQALLERLRIPVPRSLAGAGRGVASDPQLKPLWVLRDQVPVGAVTFGRGGPPVGREVIARLRAALPAASFFYLTARDFDAAGALARDLGIEHFGSGLGAREKAAFIRSLSGDAIWIGDGAASGAHAARQASSVSVSVAGLAAAPDDGADVLLLGGLHALLDLPQFGTLHGGRLARDYRTLYAANLSAVAGAFVAGFGSLQAGLVSNLGTGVIFSRHARRLEALVREHEARQAALRASIYK